MNKLEKLFYTKLNKESNKWSNYFDIYHRHFDKFLDKKINLLEIGIAHGGSLELWHKYFGKKCNLFAIDADPNCQQLKFDFKVDLAIGNQGDNVFWRNYLISQPKFDIVIDDGGHHMHEQITTLINIFPHLNNNGVLLIEDVHTSYWEEYNSNLTEQNSFVERSKSLIDFLNRQHIRNASPNEQLINIFHDLYNISFYNSVIVFEKKHIELAKPVINK